MQIIHFQVFQDPAAIVPGQSTSQYSSFLFSQPFHLFQCWACKEQQTSLASIIFSLPVSNSTNNRHYYIMVVLEVQYSIVQASLNI